MYIKEALQLWYCLFYKFSKSPHYRVLDFSNNKKFKIVKIEKIIFMNGSYAAQIFQYPQKFISILRYGDKIIHKRCIYLKNSLNFKQKTLILFDQFTEKFSQRFQDRLFSFCSNLIGRLIFLQGKVVKEGEVLVQKFERTLFKDKSFFTNFYRNNSSYEPKNFFHTKWISKFETNFSRIEFQNIKIVKKSEKSSNRNKFNLNLIDISLVGKMASLSKIGQNVTIWGIIKQKNKDGKNNRKNFDCCLSIDAISLFVEKKKNFFSRNNNEISYPNLNFLIFSQDSKIKGECHIFMKRLFSIFLGRKFSEIFKTLIIFYFLGGCVKKFPGSSRSSINVCLIRNHFNVHLNLFNQIRKFFKNTVYLSTYTTSRSNIYLNDQLISSLKEKKETVRQLLNHPLFFFIDFIDFLDPKKINLLYSLIFKRKSTITYKKTKFTVNKPLAILANLKLPKKSEINYLENRYLQEKSKKLFSFFDIIISPQDYIHSTNNSYIPLFFPLQKTSSKFSIQNFEWLLKNNQSRSISILNASRYLLFLKSFKSPIFSSGAEKLLILWYLSDTCKIFLPDIGIFFLEKLVKFSQASTKLYNRDIVLLQDTILAISILENLYLYEDKNNDFNLGIIRKPCVSIIKSKSKFLIEGTIVSKMFESIKFINTCSGNLIF